MVTEGLVFKMRYHIRPAVSRWTSVSSTVEGLTDCHACIDYPRPEATATTIPIFKRSCLTSKCTRWTLLCRIAAMNSPDSCAGVQAPSTHRAAINISAILGASLSVARAHVASLKAVWSWDAHNKSILLCLLFYWMSDDLQVFTSFFSPDSSSSMCYISGCDCERNRFKQDGCCAAPASLKWSV